jgi:hypothetical protein
MSVITSISLRFGSLSDQIRRNFGVRAPAVTA